MIKRIIFITLVLITGIFSTEFSANSAEFCNKDTELYNRWPYSPANAVAENTQYIFYGDGDIVSALRKSDMAFISKIHIPGSEGITGIFYSEDYVFASSGYDGLVTIPVADGILGPNFNQLEIESAVQSGNFYARGVQVKDGYAFIGIVEATDEGTNLGVQIVDVSNPGNPVIAGRGETAGTDIVPYGLAETVGIFVSGNYAYVIDRISGLHVFDIQQKDNPQYIGLAIAPDARDVYISNNYALVASAEYGLIVVEAYDPNTSVVEDYLIDTPTLQALYNYETAFAQSISVSGNYAYITDRWNGLQVVDVSGDLTVKFDTDNYSDNPQYGEQFLKASYNTGLSGPYSVYLSGTDAYVAEFETGLHKIDISNPLAPAASSEEPYIKPDKTDAFFLEKDGDTNYAYVVNSGTSNDGSEEGLRILEFSPYLAMRLRSFLETPGEARDIHVIHETIGDRKYIYAYIADGTNGLQIIDVTSPTDPFLEGAYTNANLARGIYVRGSHAYVADGTNGLKIIKISDKDNPELIGSFPAVDARNVVVPTGGDYAYVADGTAGLVILDISTLSNPTQVGSTVSTPGVAMDVYIFGNYAFVADGSSGLQVISIDPAAADFATIVGSHRTDGTAQGIYVLDNYAYVADGDNGFQTFDVSNPSSPVNIYSNTDCNDDDIPDERGWRYDTKGTAKDIVIDDEGEYVIVGDGPGGLSIFRLTDTEGDDDDDDTPVPNPAVSDCFIASSFNGPHLWSLSAFSCMLFLTGLFLFVFNIFPQKDKNPGTSNC